MLQAVCGDQGVERPLALLELVHTLNRECQMGTTLYRELLWAAKGKAVGRRLPQYRGLDITRAATLAGELYGTTEPDLILYS